MARLVGGISAITFGAAFYGGAVLAAGHYAASTGAAAAKEAASATSAGLSAGARYTSQTIQKMLLS